MGDAFRVGLGGPVGAGKTSLTASLCKVFSDTLSMAVITNDIYTKEDAEILMKKQVINSERILAVETGGCPHTAIREDASINLQAVDKLSKKFPDLDLILLESGGDNLSATFSPELVDYTIFMIDVCMGEEIPRKGGPAIMRSDLLIINKIDLAEYVDVSVDQMLQDAIAKRNGKPVLLTNLKQEKGVDEVKSEIMKMGNLKA
ncbi:MAG: urease accessory protein UreG [Paracoccaceae bacterium]|jgi:urease accessory protein|nr:urease accessory protein UreG [Pseudomonadota bacterium]GIR95557.1 MAG: urease accessory protein UreG [Paracoccaceae bacterium]|tara:strand:+ start:231 stop:839 length:609 start_codon:yes stop_codon:yes gene_type:complete